jgi:hypothetical protein
MQAGHILTNVAVIMVAAALWDDLRRRGAVEPRTKTCLTVACIFALVGAILEIWVR